MGAMVATRQTRFHFAGNCSSGSPLTSRAGATGAGATTNASTVLQQLARSIKSLCYTNRNALWQR
jgi:hypothetical protein